MCNVPKPAAQSRAAIPAGFIAVRREPAKQIVAAARTLTTMLYTNSPDMPRDEDALTQALERLENSTTAFAREVHAPLSESQEAGQ